MQFGDFTQRGAKPFELKLVELGLRLGIRHARTVYFTAALKDQGVSSSGTPRPEVHPDVLGVEAQFFYLVFDRLQVPPIEPHLTANLAAFQQFKLTSHIEVGWQPCETIGSSQCPRVIFCVLVFVVSRTEKAARHAFDTAFHISGKTNSFRTWAVE